MLESWNEPRRPRRSATTSRSSRPELPPKERVAVFANDRTLWCEKPMPVGLSFILRELTDAAEKDEALFGRQPWRAAYERDHARLAGTIEKHYRAAIAVDSTGRAALILSVSRGLR